MAAELQNVSKPQSKRYVSNQQINQPTKQITNETSNQPTKKQTGRRTDRPTKQTTNQIANQPTNQPTNQPNKQPNNQPTNNQLTKQPTNCNERNFFTDLPLSMRVESYIPVIPTYKASIRQGAYFCIQLRQNSSDYPFQQTSQWQFISQHSEML